MNYKKHYENLIATRPCRTRTDFEYFEYHHILPKCLGGSDDKTNLILLTAREHFIAHILLWKIHGEYLFWPIWRMSHDSRNRKITSRRYEYLRMERRKLHPWNSSSVISNLQCTIPWLILHHIYKLWILNDKPNRIKLINICKKHVKSYLNYSTILMIKWFKNYGNPLENEDWCKLANTYGGILGPGNINFSKYRTTPQWVLNIKNENKKIIWANLDRLFDVYNENPKITPKLLFLSSSKIKSKIAYTEQEFLSVIKWFKNYGNPLENEDWCKLVKNERICENFKCIKVNIQPWTYTLNERFILKWKRLYIVYKIWIYYSKCSYRTLDSICYKTHIFEKEMGSYGFTSAPMIKWFKKYGNPLENYDWTSWVEDDIMDIVVIPEKPKLRPWNNSEVKSNPDTIIRWLNLDKYYIHWKETGFVENNRMKTYFNSFGNPINDTQWLIFFNENKHLYRR